MVPESARRREALGAARYVALAADRGAHLRSSPGEKRRVRQRSEEHTSELQSLMRNSYAVFCLQKKNSNNQRTQDEPHNIHNNHDLNKATKSTPGDNLLLL